MELDQLVGSLNKKREKIFKIFVVNNPFNSYYRQFYLIVKPYLSAGCYFLLIPLVALLIGFFVAITMDLITLQYCKDLKVVKRAWLHATMDENLDLDSENMHAALADSMLTLAEKVRQRTGRHVECSDGFEQLLIKENDDGDTTHYCSFFLRIYSEPVTLNNSIESCASQGQEMNMV